MAEVEAVKEPDKIKLISYLLKRHFGQQLADIWDVGLNLALRISDLLSVRFTDIKGDRLVVHEQNAVAGLTNRVLARLGKFAAMS